MRKECAQHVNYLLGLSRSRVFGESGYISKEYSNFFELLNELETTLLLLEEFSDDMRWEEIGEKIIFFNHLHVECLNGVVVLNEEGPARVIAMSFLEM